MSEHPNRQMPDRNLALELVRVTEAAALSCAPLVGAGDKEAADQAAVDGMRHMLHSVSMDGVVVIGEGEKDEAPMLFNGEQIGDGTPPEVDIAVDPLEGTTLAAEGMPNAIAVIALSARGTMFDPGPCVYMEKMAGAPDIADLLDLDRPLGETVRLVARRRECPVSDVLVVVLDRPRHTDGIAAIRAAGARVRLIPHGDVSASLQAVTERTPVDLLWGIGGTPEGVISAAALKCLGGSSSAASGLATRPSARPRSRRAMTSNVCSPAPISWSATTSSFGDRRHRRRRAAGRAVSECGRCDNRIARDALALRHDSAHPRPPRPREAARGRRRPLAPTALRALRPTPRRGPAGL